MPRPRRRKPLGATTRGGWGPYTPTLGAIHTNDAATPLPRSRVLKLYAEKGDPKYERASLKYLRRYLEEADPWLADVAGVAALLAERAMLMRGP